MGEHDENDHNAEANEQYPTTTQSHLWPNPEKTANDLGTMQEQLQNAYHLKQGTYELLDELFGKISDLHNEYFTVHYDESM